MTQNKKFKRLVRARAAKTGESYATAYRHLRVPMTEEAQMTDTNPSELDGRSCSFCSKPQEEVRKLIAGPGAVSICDECVELCSDIIEEDPAEERPSEAEVAAAWAGMLKNRARAAQAAQDDLTKLVRQARAKGLDWPEIGESLGLTPEEAANRWGGSTP